MHHARHAISDSSEAAEGSVCIFTVSDNLSAEAGVLARGLTAYNHNLDTSREYYPKVGLREHLFDVGELILSRVQVITTRTYDDRLDTISHVRDAGISVCSGGILGLGESDADRVGLIWEASKCALFAKVSICRLTRCL
jgi:biotin synthase-like enzyme